MQGSNRVEVQVKLNDMVIFRRCDIFCRLRMMNADSSLS